MAGTAGVRAPSWRLAITRNAALTGDALPSELPATAKAWEAGLLDPEHLRAIQKFHRLPGWREDPQAQRRQH